MIQLTAVSKLYPTQSGSVTALSDIHLEIQTGEIFGIIGKSGAGKTTLLHCMNGLEKPSQGQILLDGVDLYSPDTQIRRKARQKIGMIFQNFNLLQQRTVFENIALPMELQHYPSAKIRARVAELLDLVHLNDKSSVYPSALSGGQKQRVAIARALTTEPNILFCDEATSALDTQTTIVILDLLKEVHARLNLTVVLITHELSVVKRICDRVAVLEHGSIAEIGDTLTVFTQPKAAATRDLIAAKRHLPHSIMQRMSEKSHANSSPLLLLTFFGIAHAQPIMAQLIQRYNLNLSILQADIETIHSQSVGTMLVECPSTPEVLANLIEYLQNHQVQVEVLGHVANPIL